MRILTRICVHGHAGCAGCIVIALLLLGSAMAPAPAGADAPLWISCAAPMDLATAATCAGYAEMTLDATVHIRMISRCVERPEGEYWTFDSHATILDDNTLLTHNHYRILGDRRCALRRVTFYTPGGKIIADTREPAALAEITRQLHSQDSRCSLEACRLTLSDTHLIPPYGVRFACPGRAAMINLPEVAEINWGGKPGSAFVQWTRPVGLSMRGEVSVLEMASGIREGASGGGVYIPTGNGVTHIGTCLRTRVDAPGSVAALNPAGMGE